MLRCFLMGWVALSLFAGSATDTQAKGLVLSDYVEIAKLARGGGPSIPAAWAGVWNDADSLHLCSDPTVFFTITDTDTLCAGDPIEEEVDGVELSCSGTYDDQNANLTCTGSDEVNPGCVVEYQMTLVATRNGDSAFATATLNATYEPSGCDNGNPDTCLVVETTSTRIGPQPPECATAVEPGSWGRIKARYR